MIIQAYAENNNSNINNFSDFVKQVFVEVIQAACNFIKEELEKLDEDIMQNRDKSRFRCKDKRKTSVKTKLGVIEFERRLYLDTKSGEYVYLLDEAVDVHSVGLVDDELCKLIADIVCEMPFRQASKVISQLTGLSISHQGVWDITQKIGRAEREKTDELSALNQQNKLAGAVETKILYNEADGVYLKLQGESRKKYGPSKEMKVSIAYDGVIYHPQKNGKPRRELDNKVAYANFETAKDFRKHKDALIAEHYDTDHIELMIKNGDGAQWIQKEHDCDCDCICVLDKFHRNKKLIECVSDKAMLKTLQQLLYNNEFDRLLEVIEAYANSVDEEKQVEKLHELYRYYSENFDSLSSCYDRGIKIPETREPGIIHHARLGSMESNIFTLIGNRMKGRRANWSIEGGNNLAILLCRHHTRKSELTVPLQPKEAAPEQPLSAARVPERGGKGYEPPHTVHTDSTYPVLYDICR